MPARASARSAARIGTPDPAAAKPRERGWAPIKIRPPARAPNERNNQPWPYPREGTPAPAARSVGPTGNSTCRPVALLPLQPAQAAASRLRALRLLRRRRGDRAGGTPGFVGPRSQTMRQPGKGPVIGVDAMGGDLAPRAVIEGAMEALREPGTDLDVALIGDEQEIRAEATRLGILDRLPRVIHAAEVIEMAESAAQSVRKKRDSSISVAARLHKSGETDAFVSAGNTGAVVAAALFEMGRIAQIHRPAIATVLPTPQGNVVILDVGATSDCKPSHLYQ